jgi:competence protein ComEC
MKHWVVLILLILCMGCMNRITEPPVAPDNGKNISVIFIDVGQGDSILILYNNTATLIDAGKTEYGITVLQYLKRFGVTHLNYVVMTHEHEDHFGGFQAVFTEYIPDIFIYTRCDSQACNKRVLSPVKGKSETIHPRAGTLLNMDPDLNMKVLSPPSGGFTDVNDNSIVIRMDYGKTSFLFMGDAEKGAEEYMMDTGEDLDIDVLKVGHHGSSDSVTDEFMKETTPEIAVISVGESNSYGHPDQITIDILRNAGTRIFRTDQDGSVLIESDGNGLIVQTHIQ